MDEEEIIILKIPTAREKLLPLFPNDPKSDFKLIFKSKVYYLVKGYLRLESAYFKRICTGSVTEHELNEDFNENAVENVLSCFYGASVRMNRALLGDYYQILRFFEIECLIGIIRNDILSSIENYDLFAVMRIAHRYADQKLFEICLEQLEIECFEQLKYHQFELLQTDLSLFKLIIKAHNMHRSEGKSGQEFTEIDQLIKDYCEGNGMDQDAYRALKFELIDRTTLTAQEYKEIFMDEVTKMKNQAVLSDYPTGQSMLVNGNVSGFAKLDTPNLAQSIIDPVGFSQVNKVSSLLPKEPMGYSSINKPYASQFVSGGVNELSLEMENTFQKKRNEELSYENKVLGESLTKLKQLTDENQKIHCQMQNELYNLKEELHKKERIEENHKKTINRFEKIMNELQNQLNQKTKDILSLKEQFEELSTDDGLVASTLLPADIIHTILGSDLKEEEKVKQSQAQGHIKNKMKLEEMSSNQLYLLYKDRIHFDIEPCSTPLYNFPKLCDFINKDTFAQYSLQLIYRRSTSRSPIGKNADIKERKSLVILISTNGGHNIGGYASVPIPKSNIDYVEDYEAYIFSLTKDQKFKVKQSEASYALFISNEYLVCFANDLMIANDCLRDKSESSWPSSYEGSKNSNERSPNWLCGGKEFGIRDLEIYEIREQGREMVV